MPPFHYSWLILIIYFLVEFCHEDTTQKDLVLPHNFFYFPQQISYIKKGGFKPEGTKDKYYM